MARKPGRNQKESPVGCTGEGKIGKGNIGEDKRGTVMELSLEVMTLVVVVDINNLKNGRKPVKLQKESNFK